jgi:hypothetical protein
MVPRRKQKANQGNMKKLLILTLATLSAGITYATDLYFTASSVVYNTNQAFLAVGGPTGTNLVCALERLDLTNQTLTDRLNLYS